MIHENSIQSHQQHVSSGKAETWRRQIYFTFSMNPEESYTDREIIDRLKANDVNLVRPEITKMLHDGLLVESHKVKCPTTRRTVRACKWSGAEYIGPQPYKKSHM